MEKIVIKYGTFLTSIVILVILGVQTLAVVFRFHVKSWPFTDYPMYCSSHQVGERIDVLRPIFATFADKSEKQIFPKDLGLTVFQFENLLVRAILCAAQDKKELQSGGCVPQKAEEQLKALLRPYKQQQGKHIISLRLEDYPYILTKEGPKKVPAQVLQVLEL